ncbi:hypothetical protein D3C81_1938010 [compost metagenome]
MGVAVSVSTSTLDFSRFSFSLCATPNRCSSSTMRRPKSLKIISADNRRWVPMTISTVPFLMPLIVSFCSFLERKRESTWIWKGKPENRSRKVS